MALSAEFENFLKDLLAGFGPITLKRAFGLNGIMAEDVMLGFVQNDTIYFRTDDSSRADYEAEGGKPFEFDASSGHVVTRYYSIPDRLLDDPDEMAVWARKAHAAALESPTAKKKRRLKARGAAPRKRKAAR